MNRFDDALRIGRIGEQIVERWLQSRGCGVIPSYDYTAGERKAPRMMFAARGLVVPDLDAARRGQRAWLEVKTYRHPVFNRTHACLVHGIKRRHYEDYLAVEEESGCPVFLGILETDAGTLLLGRLRRLVAWPCLCRGCRRGNGCRLGHGEGVSAGVYFARDAFTVAQRFDEQDMNEVRRALQRGAERSTG